MKKEAAWRKELSEHPWATKAVAKRIAKDHAAKKRMRHPQKGSGAGPIQTAHKDFVGLASGAQRIASRRVI
jgi:hypothetical protein